MIVMMRIVLFVGGLLLLAACGSKGPLVLPPKPAAAQGAPAQQVAPADDSTAPGGSR